MLVNCPKCDTLNWVSDHPLPGSSSTCLSCRNSLDSTSDDADSATLISAREWPTPTTPNFADSTGSHFDYFTRGCDLWDSGSHDEAIDAFGSALSLDPNFVWAYVRRGHAYLNLRRYEQAIEDFDRAINLDSNYAEAYKLRGAAYDGLGRYENASNDFVQAFRLESRSTNRPSDEHVDNSARHPNEAAGDASGAQVSNQQARAGRLSLHCPRCQTVNEPGSAFCYQCGLPLDDESAQPSRPVAAKSPTPYRYGGAAIYSRPAGFRSPNARANWTQVLLGISIVIYFLLIAVSYSEIELLGRIEAGQFVTESEIKENDDGKVGILVVSGLIFILTTIPFLMWVYRAAENLRALNRRELQFSPGWAVVWWFIPIMWFFRPYQALREVWKASDPLVSPDDPTGWSRSPASSILGWWWATWLIFNGLSFISVTLESGEVSTGELIAADWFQITAVLVQIVSGVLLFIIVRSITSRQNEAYDRMLHAQSDSNHSRLDSPTHQTFENRAR